MSRADKYRNGFEDGVIEGRILGRLELCDDIMDYLNHPARETLGLEPQAEYVVNRIRSLESELEELYCGDLDFSSSS